MKKNGKSLSMAVKKHLKEDISEQKMGIKKDKKLMKKAKGK